MRRSSRGTHFRVSSRVDQMTCRTPACFAASAMLFASASSFSGEKCSQKKVTQNAPWAPWNALFRLSASSMSTSTTSAPRLLSSFALPEPAFLVRARTL